MLLRAPNPDEVLVKVAATAICHSDLHDINGDFGGGLPFVGGHETAGRVAEVGSGVSSAGVGDPVVEGLLWGLAVFAVSAWAGWWLRRKGQVEVGLLPGSILLTVAVFNGDLKKGITWLVLAAPVEGV